jgi:hypothetical protein
MKQHITIPPRQHALRLIRAHTAAIKIVQIISTAQAEHNSREQIPPTQTFAGFASLWEYCARREYSAFYIDNATKARLRMLRRAMTAALKWDNGLSGQLDPDNCY